jgi:hypothetical protein
MPPLFKTSKFKRWFAVVVVLSIAAYFFAPRGTISGIVLDKATSEPIEGAYVVAVYYDGGSDFVHSYSWCVKTKGMYTGKDGKFSFPMERHGYPSLAAIKWDYISDGYEYPKRGDGTVKTYTETIFHLYRQDPAKPEFNLSGHDVSCTRASWRDDVEASLEFFRIEQEELERLGAEHWLLRSQAALIKEHDTMLAHAHKWYSK